MARVAECFFGACILLCFLQTHLAGAQECRTCYRSVSYQATRVVSRRTSYSTRCFVFFRCTRYRTVYRSEAYTAYRTASYCCRGTGSIASQVLRLAGGSSESSGRLEVYYSGLWGTVCDDLFGSNDAEVACMQLGFAGRRRVTSEFGRGSGRIWLDDVQCTGTETWLANCSRSTWGVHNCGHHEDVGVICNSALQIRLVGGGSNPFSGRVEYYVQGIWATVCDDYFSTTDGNVVCNQLGYGNAIATRHFGSGSGSIAFDDLACSGNEISLLFCPHLGLFSHNCGHSEDAGVICEGPKPTITSVRASSSDLSIALAWQMPWQLKYQNFITGYRVQFGTSTRTSTLQSTIVSTTAANSSTTISSLAPYTTYYFRVALRVSASRFGPYSDFVSARTIPGDPQALISLTGSASSATSVRVTWRYSASSSSLTSSGGYLIQYRAVSPQGISDAGGVRVSRYTSSYTIRGLEEGVQYMVTVNAYIGSRNGPSRSTRVTTYARAPTGPPQSVTAYPSSSSSVRVTWSPPQLRLQNGPITGYRITCTPSVLGSPVSVTASSSSSGATVAGLAAYTQYSCKVAARSQRGDGPYSRSTVVVTAEAVPTGAPINVRAVTIGSTTIHLQWSPPPTNAINGVPLDYVISYGLANNRGSPTRVTTGDTRTRYEFTSLEPYTAYSFQVAVRNSIGMGPYSGSVSTVTATDVPGASPQSVSVRPDSSFTIRVAWSQPPVDQQKGPIIRYSVVYGVRPALEQAQSTRAVAVGSPYFVRHLAPYTEYYIKVAAATVNGTGPYSSIYTAKTYAYIPSGSPEVVSFTPHENHPVLTLSWTPPEESALNGPLSGISYQVRYGMLGNLTTEVAISSSQTSGSGVQQYVLTNLEYGTTYAAQVAAVSSNGTGPWSNAITQVTVTINAKNPPQNVTVVALGAYSVRVAWSPPADDGNTEPITGYRVVYGRIGVGASSSTTATVLSAVLSHLAPFTNYFVRVAALRMEADGVYSNDVFVQTRSAVPTGSPRDISLQISARQISLTWKPPAQGEANGPVTGYEILLVRDGQERSNHSLVKRAAKGQMMYTVGGHQRTSIIKDLEPYKGYCLQMAAVNVNGTGPFSNASCFTTLQDAPGPISSLNVTTVSSTELNVTWNPPTSPNGIILRYILAFTSVPELNLPHQGELTSNMTSVVLSGLHEGVQYHLRVKAITVVGPGPELMSTGTTYTAAPSAPPSAVHLQPQSAYSISVNWTLPPLVDRNGPITGYVLRHWQANEAPETNRDTAIGLVQMHRLENLQPFTGYSVQVAAVNVNGTGPFSTFQETKTLSAAPGAPENLTALNTSAHQIRVLWDPPSSPNGILLGYKLTYEATAPAGVLVIVYTLNISETAVELEGLLEGVTYRITVAAVNEIGESDEVTTQRATSPAVPDSPPLNFRILNIGVHSMDLTWSPPMAIHRNGPLVEYIVTYGIEGENVETTQKLKANEMNIEESEVVVHTIERLTPYTKYFFVVAFANPAGRSDFTDKVVNMTLPDVPSLVRNLTTAEFGGSFVVIQWLPPDISYGSIIDYQIYVDGEVVHTGLHPLLTFNVTNLTCGASYSIGVTAGNSAGHGRVNQVRIRTSRRVGDAEGKVDENNPVCGPDSIAVTTGSSIGILQAAQYGVIGGIIVIVGVIFMCTILCCICCVRRYKKVKATAAANSDEMPNVEYTVDPLYEEIPFDKMAASDDEKGLEAEAASIKYENPYTFGPHGANAEHSGASPIVHDSEGCIKDEDGSICEEDMYVDGIAPDTVHVSPNGRQVYYNTSPAKGDQPLYDTPTGTEFPYDVPKSNKEAPKEAVVGELGVHPLETVSSEYEIMHTSDTLVAGSSGPGMES